MKEALKHNWFILLIGFLFFAINFSGDHIFYKTNTLKLTQLAVSCCLLFIVIMFRLRHQSEKSSFKDCISFIGLALLPIVATLPGYVANGLPYSHFSLHEYSVHLLCVMWGGIILFSIKNQETIYWFFRFAALVIAYLFIVSIFQSLGFKPLLRLGINFFDASWANWQIPFSGVPSRIAATAGNPNYLAGMVIQFLPVFASLLLISKSNVQGLAQRQWIFHLFIVVALTYLCLVSGSRGGLIALTLSGLFYLVVGSRSKLIQLNIKLFLVTGGIAFIALGYLVIHDNWLNRLTSIGIDSSSITRVHIWKAAGNAVANAPILGYGTGSSYSLFFSFVDPDIRLYTSRSFVHPHNDLLEVLQEGGLLALSVYLIFWLSVFVRAVRFVGMAEISTNTRLLALGLLAGLLAVHLQGMVSVAPRMVVVRIVTYSLLACLLYITGLPQFSSFRFIGGIRRYTWSIGASFSLLTALITGYVGFYSYGQWGHALTIARSELEPRLVINAAEAADYSDVFLLDRAIDVAQKANLNRHALRYSETLINEIAHYRDVDFERAFSLFRLAQYEQAYEAAKYAYGVDRYHLQNLQLLAYLSHRYQKEEEFRQYVVDMLQYHLCKSTALKCLPIVAEPLSGDEVIGLAANEAHYLVNSDALLGVDSDTSGTSKAFFFLGTNEIVSLLSKSPLMANEAKSTVPDRVVLTRLLDVSKRITVLEDQLRKLAVYSGEGVLNDRRVYLDQSGSIQQQIDLLHRTVTELKESLPQGFDFQRFMDLRQLVIDYTKSYTNAIQFDKLASLSQ